MEILGEFDNESPLYVSFCKRISPEAFERQSCTYTQKSLEELYTQMELNPGVCERLIRKRKQVETEEGGLASYLKAKFFSLFNHGSSLKEEEIHKEVECLMCEMRRVSTYALAAKRVSQWPLERKPRRNIPLERFGSSQSKRPDPAVPSMPKIFGPYPMPVKRAMGSNTDLKHS
ncbi:uncharacterized protein LOC143822279 isoform X2 [Paroedura picta]|uniref:uncharacterized protein LOC143822279 isoform X2 n=1 Tax=Paroedura picta TaxID=143630 RepID=UPI0040567B36